MILKEQQNEQVYSDGKETEKRMLEIAKNYPEDLVQEYIADNSEYTVNNTFSSVRQNILNWYPFKSNARILEIGAGMGSLTGFLCDKAEHVTAVEMSSERADVIRARYPERKNLEIVSYDITKWNTEEKYDYVIMIGVLEYAAVFSDCTDPFVNYLECAKKFLYEDGTLLVAIENRFGVKYWLGASEDHLQQPYVGISGYEIPKTPRTFSKYELEQIFGKAGFGNQRFYYVYPEYKFPELVYTDEFVPNYANLQKVSFTYAKNSILGLDEKKVYKDLVENKVWQFFANSFLVEAKMKDANQGKKVLHVSARGETKKEYRVSTVIMDDNKAYKVPVHPEAKKHIKRIYDNTQHLKNCGINVLDTKYSGDNLETDIYEGISAQKYVHDMLLNNDRKELFKVFEILRKDLLRSSELEYEKNILHEISNEVNKYHVGPILKEGFIDMTFYNAFYSNDELIYYDQEWNFENVPLNFILYYAVKSVYFRFQEKTDISFEEILNYLGIGEEKELFDRLEDYIWSKVLYRQTDFYGEGGYCNRFSQEQTVQQLLNLLEENKKVINNYEITQREKQIKIEELEREFVKAQQEYAVKEEKIKSGFIDKQLELEQIIRNKEGHIQLLLPPERELIAIKNSKMFKMMRTVCRSYDIVMTVPRFIMRNVFAFCRMLTHVNVPKLKIAWGYVKEEGIQGAYHHLMRDYHQGEIKQIKIDVEEKIHDEIQSLDNCEILELPQYEKPIVSIVIPAYNQFTYTYYCIKSIIKNSGNVPYEVILADDCSNDLTVEITKVVKNLIVSRTEKNMLFLRNCNHAAKEAKGKYILFLNNDTEVQKDWLKPLVDLIERDQTIGMVGSKLVYADGTLQEAGGIIWRDGSGWNHGRNMDAMLPEYNYVKDVDYISGAAIMIRHDLWKQIGGFDELFAPAYCEDSDLAFEVRKAGYRVVYQPLSVVVHYEGKSNGTDLNAGVKKYQIENNLKLRKKWEKEFSELYENGQNVFKARERSKDKKVILVIDHYVPQFDKDAGSKTTFQYLKLFISQGYSVKFIGDNFYQDEPYTTVLQQMGVEVLYGPWYAQHWQEWILENKKNIDFAYLNRPHITIKYIDFLKEKTDIKCIYYGHDLHFLRLRREYELTGNREKLAESEEWLEKELYIMRRAEMNYYPSYVEEEEIHKIDSAIPVKAITAYVYEQFLSDIQMDFAKREGIMFVGGFGHPPNEDAVLWFAEKVYPLIAKEKEIPFYIIGSRPTDKIKALNSKNIIVKGFVSEEELRELYNTCKLVVVPLRYGAGVKGKVVESIYYGAPMVTTTVGIEGIEGAENIIEVADNERDFADSVLKLYSDNELLRNMSEEYQNFVKTMFSVDAVWNIVKEDFN